ncbi:hypothetical protein ACFUIW_18355 [Streptomyces sp. NPDC057245]|uniref:hypothetical protein n=1 Tax=Streptomyces sp. NPDC057245 TaxID=3346065 RepID=UPI00362F476B
MRNADPFEMIDRHRDTIFRVLGLLALALIVFLVLRHLAMRQGGWGAAARRVRRELAISAHAFAAPVRSWARYRRTRSLLVRGLRRQTTWRDAERAVAAAREAAAPFGGIPYAVLVDDETVTVLLAGRDLPQADEAVPGTCWWTAPGDPPNHWTAARPDLPAVVPVPDLPHPVLVAVGARDGSCAFLDVAAGRRILTVQGDPRCVPALHQAIAAQLAARLPAGLVVVAEGVHHQYAGSEIRTAYRTAREMPTRHGIAPVLVAAELPDPLPPELTGPPESAPGPQIVLRGTGRGQRRTLTTDRHGRIALLGTPLVLEGNALSRAVARVLPDLPPVLPPVPPSAGRPDRVFAELDEEESVLLSGEDAEDDWGTTGGASRPPAAERDEREGEADAGADAGADADADADAEKAAVAGEGAEEKTAVAGPGRRGAERPGPNRRGGERPRPGVAAAPAGRPAPRIPRP